MCSMCPHQEYKAVSVCTATRRVPWPRGPWPRGPVLSAVLRVPALLAHVEHGFAERGTCRGAGSGAELCSALGCTVQRTFNVK